MKFNARFVILLSWVSLSFLFAAAGLLLPFGRHRINRARVRCLVHAFIAGTGWGGDDGVLMLLLRVKRREELLEEIIQIDTAGGKEPVIAELLVRMLRAAPPDLAQ